MDDGKACREHKPVRPHWPRFRQREPPIELPPALNRVAGAHSNLVALTLYCRHQLYETVIEPVLEEFFPFFPIRLHHGVVQIKGFCSAVALNSAVHLVHIPDPLSNHGGDFIFIVQV